MHPRRTKIIFSISLLGLALSSLLFFPAPSAVLWVVAILMDEWGHFIALFGLLLLFFVDRDSRWGRLSQGVAILAAGLLLSTSVRAWWLARTLPSQSQKAWGTVVSSGSVPTGSRRAPFSLKDLFTGIPSGPVDIREYIYASSNREIRHLDLYRGRHRTGPEPVLIVIHGGSWSGSSKRELPAMSRYFAARGIAVAAVNYGLAPEHPWPAASTDVFRAIDYLKSHAKELDLDATRMVVLGRSAGGQIALEVAYAEKEPAIRGVVSFYGPADLILGYENPSPRRVLDSKKVLEEYLGGPLNSRRATYVAASPLMHVNAKTPPTLLIHGRLDPMVWAVHSERLSRRLEEMRRPYQYLAIPWGTHGCDANLSGPSGQLSLYAIENFLRAVYQNP